MNSTNCTNQTVIQWPLLDCPELPLHEMKG